MQANTVGIVLSTIPCVTILTFTQLYFVLCLPSSSPVLPPPPPTLVSSLCISRLWPHHSSVWHWEGLLHPLRPDRRSLHHAGAHRLRPEAHVPSGPRSSRPPAAFRHGASAGDRRPLRVASGSGGAVFLHRSGCGVQRGRVVLVVLGRHLLLFHLTVHHRAGGFRSRDTAWAEKQAAVSGLCHGWVPLLLSPA